MQNQSDPDNGEVPNAPRVVTTRRQALRGTVALAACAAAVTVTTIAAATADPDAELVRLYDEYHRLDGLSFEAEDRLGRAEAAAREHFPPWPESLIIRVLYGNPDGSHQYCALDAEGIAREFEIMSGVVGEENARQIREKRLKNFRPYEAQCNAVRQAHGVPALQRAAQEAYDAAREALRRFLETPAQSAKGIALKLQLADETEEFHLKADDPESPAIAPKAIVAALQDAERLARRAAS